MKTNLIQIKYSTIIIIIISIIINIFIITIIVTITTIFLPWASNTSSRRVELLRQFNSLQHYVNWIKKRVETKCGIKKREKACFKQFVVTNCGKERPGSIVTETLKNGILISIATSK